VVCVCVGGGGGDVQSVNMENEGTVLAQVSDFNLLKTKRNLLYIRNQSVPRCKHFPPRL